MTIYFDQRAFDLLPFDRELIVDFFAGGGGASKGIEMALGRSPDIAVNHDEEAVAMHRANHPNTIHLQHDVWKVTSTLARLIGNRPVGIFWASPDCKHFSKAKGGKPVKRKIRDLAWVVVKFARTFRPRRIFLENVEEFRDWGPLVQKVDDDGRPMVDLQGRPVMVPCKKRKGQTFMEWVAALQRLGYRIEWREIRAFNYGAGTIRKRLFLIARRDGRPIVWPDFSHENPAKIVDGSSVKPWDIAANHIDFTLPCPSIFMTAEEARAYHKATGIRVKRPLEANTMARVAKGFDRFVLRAAKPYLVNLTHHGAARNEPLDEPGRTTTAAHRGEKALVTPYLVPRYGEREGQEPRARSIETPSAAIVPTANGASLVAPILTYAQQGGAVRAANEPSHTFAASAKDQNQLIVPIIAGVGGRMGQTEPRGGNAPGQTLTAKADSVLVAPHLMTMRDAAKPHNEADRPSHTITAGGAHIHLVAAFMAQHNLGVVGHELEEPVSTLTQTASQQNLVAAHLINQKGSDQRAADAGVPSPAVCAQGTHLGAVSAFMTKYYGVHQESALDEPGHTATAKARFGLVIVHIEGEPYVVVDIGMRMLVPRELYGMQGFPKDYIIAYGVFIDANGRSYRKKLTITAAIRMVGNSVSPPPAAALIGANCNDMVTERIAA
jgi:DNA (cytosine-5)-methyltransferase 1